MTIKHKTTFTIDIEHQKQPHDRDMDELEARLIEFVSEYLQDDWDGGGSVFGLWRAATTRRKVR